MYGRRRERGSEERREGRTEERKVKREEKGRENRGEIIRRKKVNRGEERESRGGAVDKASSTCVDRTEF